MEGRNVGTHTNAAAFALDFGVPRGTEVLAAMNGIVVDIVSNEPDLAPGTRGSAEHGNLVRIRHDDLTYGIYGHLQQNGVRVTVGQRVTAGTVLALSGNSGFTNGDHLHFAVERATLTGYETLDFDLFDSSDNAFVPAGGKICEAGSGVVAGKVLSGTDDPEGQVAGDQGDFYVRLNGPVGQLFYVKESGAAGSNTGWKAKAALP